MLRTDPSSCAEFDAEFDDQFKSSPPALSVAGREHLSSCARCRSLYDWAMAPLEMPSVAPARMNVPAEIRSSIEAVRPLPPTALLAAQFLAVFGVLAFALSIPTGVAGWHTMRPIEALATSALLALAAVFAAFSMAGEMVPSSPRLVSSGFLLAATLVALGLDTAALFPWNFAQPFVTEGFPCALMEITISIPAAAAFWWMARRGAPLSVASLALSVSGFAGLLAFGVLQIRCPHQQAPHLIIWHLGGVVAVVAAGSAAGRMVRNRIPV